MIPRALLGLLGAVALSAAVLSFAALRDLALLCGFDARLAWLLPVVVDAGAAAGTLVWLGGNAPARARRFACCLALVLLGSSVAANAVSHVLTIDGARAPGWVVALASGVAPAVLGAVAHLVALCRRVDLIPDELAEAADPPAALPLAPAEREDPGGEVGEASPAVALHLAPAPTDRAAELIAAGAGRRKLARELGISEHEARELLAARREGAS